MGFCTHRSTEILRGVASTKQPAATQYLSEAPFDISSPGVPWTKWLRTGKPSPYHVGALWVVDVEFAPWVSCKGGERHEVPLGSTTPALGMPSKSKTNGYCVSCTGPECREKSTRCPAHANCRSQRLCADSLLPTQIMRCHHCVPTRPSKTTKHDMEPTSLEGMPTDVSKRRSFARCSCWNLRPGERQCTPCRGMFYIANIQARHWTSSLPWNSRRLT